MTKQILSRCLRKWMKLRLQPIQVFCLHHVCKHFDANVMNACDWMEISSFQSKINDLREQGVQFISLLDAYQHLQNDWIRTMKYAVLTFDDGYKSLLEVLPWLEEQQIPATLFINGKYLDGMSYRITDKEEYLTYNELFALDSPLIEIGHHGWEHTKATEMSKTEFIDSIENNKELLSKHSRYIPFWAYTWGVNNEITNQILIENCITPVFINGNENYNNTKFINREPLE